MVEDINESINVKMWVIYEGVICVYWIEVMVVVVIGNVYVYYVIENLNIFI